MDKTNEENLGNGIAASVNGNTLTLTVKLDRPGVVSASGKTMVNASTRGAVTIPGTNGLTVNLNVYTKK